MIRFLPGVLTAAWIVTAKSPRPITRKAERSELISSLDGGRSRAYRFLISPVDAFCFRSDRYTGASIQTPHIEDQS
jgi:hypothetical protein